MISGVMVDFVQFECGRIGKTRTHLDTGLVRTYKRIHERGLLLSKVENIFKGSLDLIPSPSPLVKTQIMCRKVWLRCKGKLLKTKSLLTSFSNVLSNYFK